MWLNELGCARLDKATGSQPGVVNSIRPSPYSLAPEPVARAMCLVTAEAFVCPAAKHQTKVRVNEGTG